MGNQEKNQLKEENSTMKETFADIKKAMDHVRSEIGSLPIRVKINPLWMKENLEKCTVIKDANVKYRSIFGLPFETDSSVKTFEFVYDESSF
jgi:hypothetical protein